MKWFDRSDDIKGRDSLGQPEVEYLTRPSVTVFGPLNVLFRRQWDVVLALIVLAFVGNGIQASLPDIRGGLGARWNSLIDHPVALILNILLIVLYAALIYFSVKHGRRLAWNRNEWKDFDTFQKSEARWKPWGWVMLAAGVLLVVVSLLM